MRWGEAKAELIQHFSDEWIGIHSSMAVNFPNEGEENAEDENADAESGEWLRFRVLSSYSHRVVVGGQTRQQGGRVVIHVFTPFGMGDGRSDILCGELESIYETAHDNGLSGDIHLEAPEPITAMLDEATQQYVSGRVIPFSFDHTP